MASGVIERQADFDELCRHVAEAGLVAFDTEFVTEYTWQPELCLLQFATSERCEAVDPQGVESLDAWWDLMCDDATTVVVHGGQAEVRFCLAATGKRPRKLVDVQIAEGLRSPSYPLGYNALVGRVLGRRVHGRETRTDWRRRPLSSRQVNYACEDVQYILPIWEKQRNTLASRGRLDWADAEFSRMIGDVEEEWQRPGWQRLPGLHKLRPRELVTAQALADWRDDEAERKNKPARRVLRDDLLIELARRRPRTINELQQLRDMTRSNYRRAADELLACIEQAGKIPDAELPPGPTNEKSPKRHPDEHVLGQLLNIALLNRCAEMEVARQLVGTSADLRELVRYHVFGERDDGPPRLASGWRREVCGDLLTNLLDGRVSLRVGDPQSDHPLVFEERDQSFSP